MNYMQNISKKNIQTLKDLKETALSKINNNDEIIDLSSIYGMFLPRGNKFIFCKEEKFEGDNALLLREFFTNEYVASNEVRFGDIVYPWRKTGRKFSLHFNDLVFYVSIADLLGESYINKNFTKKDISHLYCAINEYLNENPTFVNQLLENEKKKQR